MIEIVIVILCGVWAAAIWAMVCNHRTHLQRKQIIDRVFAVHAGYQVRLRKFELVSYEQHLLALFLFRNPWNLYSPEIVGESPVTARAS